ncbi:MAG: reverse transcriptase/maturase family protein [Thiobacillus sp.]|uniref:reverse transcriptase/maturase family protein n=1 Tax=Thiobacillus sp. TaxID=924 RepID=UPI002893BC1D|nr:reverse transcriptase/maturase family protein [Thiobacillus sp.]MDT3708167.1 reverse transcriptase/maturase family protein [Thiobacillus sp.]
MKRHGNLFERAFSQENLYASYLDARKNKRATRSCFAFEKRLGAGLSELHEALHTGTYAPLPYNTFRVHEPKPRLIHAPAFCDRVVQHAIYRVIQPIFDASFIDQSFACRPGKGTHAASDYVQHALAQVPRDSYLLQLDIRRFYYSIDRAILRCLIERKLKDVRLVEVMMLFAETGDPVGVPIGNLLSQLYALIYLNPLDHYVKRDLRVRYYARYVDDFILVGIGREQALSARAEIVDFLADRLHLELSKSIIQRVTRGANFVGYRTWSTRSFVRKHALYTFRRAAVRGALESVVSSLGHARRTASCVHMLRHLENHHADLYRRLPQGLRPVFHLPARRA